MNNKTFRIYDASICITSKIDRPQRGANWLTQPDYETYNRILKVLRDSGFNVHKDPRIEEHFKTLSKYHDAGEKNHLHFKSEVYPVGCKFEFYQNIVFENSSGGFYDFNKLEKMPYLIKKAFECATIKVAKKLTELGFTEAYKEAKSPNPDPLRYFNDKWDDEYNRKRGDHRFQRGPDGWPSDKEVDCWNRKDKDGIILTQGCVRYSRSFSGYLMRGRVYGGINGRWLFVYGPGQHDFTFKNAGEFFSCDPRTLSRRDWVEGDYNRSILKRLNQKKESAIVTESYEKEAKIRDAISKLEKVAA